MNFIRKMSGGVRGDVREDSGPTSPDNNLGLMHLRKLFGDFRQPPPGTSQRELEGKLYTMLPLFCKVFGTAPSIEMTQRFEDILQFCSHVSRLMVSEIRRRASNQSTDAASCAIVKFLEIESTEESSNGWMLLSTLNLLSLGPSSLIDCMTAASLPSTLVKCLYLFFDLPDVMDADALESGCEFTPRERRVLLQKVFVQVLVRLCGHVSPAEELARKDDLTLLYSAITSWCPPHNVPWRKSAAEVLMTLSRHGLTQNLVQYIHNKGCVAHCIDNMQRVQELSPIELVEMFVTVFCFLKDSSEVSQTLLDDFRACQGYVFLSEFLLRMERDENEEAIQALRNLVLLVGSLTACGFIELKPSTASSGSLFQMPGFAVPQPAGKGLSVRNIQAFQVLQTVFIKAQSSHLCNVILDVMSSIYHQDDANYFILEPQNTLSQFAERVHLKPSDIQTKFFEIIEFIVFNLNFVPCKELISLSILIKTNHNTNCSILCMKTLMRILKCHNVYKDVFREVGLLEVMVTCLHRYAALLKELQTGNGVLQINDLDQEMGFLTQDALSSLLNNNNSNASVFRECGGARCAHNMVPYTACRHQALSIVQQLVLSTGGDDDMGTLLGLMHTANTTSLELKTHILKSLLNVLRESHRTRTVFRKVGGFVYVMSVLVSMEGCLAEPPKPPWDTVNREDIVMLLKTVFSTLTVAMRYEPANARFFATEVRYASLTEAVRLLGCFGHDTGIQLLPEGFSLKENNIFVEIFNNGCKEPYNLKQPVPQMLLSACMMLRYLYDMALDYFDRPVTTNGSNGSPNMKRISSVLEASSGNELGLLPIANSQKHLSTGSLSLVLGPSQPETLVVHAGAIISLLHLVPAITCYSNYQLATDLQSFTCDVLKSVMRSERNQQLMCEAGLPHELLSHATLTLADETHPLHPPVQYMFERLSAQSLTPKDLRDFLRLGNPLCCAAEDEESYDARRLQEASSAGPTFAVIDHELTEEKRSNDINKRLKTNGGAVPLTRVKCLVSMTTPRDVRLHGASITPAFVEFDMSAEGFGCLYLPSIAPQGPPTPSVVGAGMIGGNDPGVVGGIGAGERLFPPQSGLTFCSWVCVDKFSAPSSDPHRVRLLTIVRHIQGRDDHLICLNVFLSPRDRALFVCTTEFPMPTAAGVDSELEPSLSDTVVRFWCPEITQEGQWRQLVLVFHKAGIMKNSSVSLFVDGKHISTQKLHYISPNLGGGGTASPNAATSVYSYVGTPHQLRRQSRLIWRQGPCYLLEDVTPPATIQQIYQLGPNYVGSFQAPITDAPDSGNSVICEEKIMFGVHAHAMSLMTVAKIRKVYSKVDAKSIAKQLNMSAHENATPIRILHNSAGNLNGPARSFGAILMGYLGVRTFCPKPVAKMILNVGGINALLGLIAMATDVEGLYAAVKALVCVVRSNKSAQREMDRTRAYQTLAVLLKKKRLLLNSHILHLTFSLVGTVDSGRESTVIPNKTAFDDILCDLEVWHEAPSDLQRSLYEHFYELLTESSEQKSNAKLMLELGMVKKMIYILHDSNLSKITLKTIMSVMKVLLAGATHEKSLLRFGQFMVSLLPNSTLSEKMLSLEDKTDTLNSWPSPEAEATDYSGSVTLHNIRLRNMCLEMLFKLMTTSPTSNGINTHMCDEILRVLGLDWLLLFLQHHLHSSTVILTTRIILAMLHSPLVMQKFREGNIGGGWLDDTEQVLQNRIGVVLGFNMGSGSTSKLQSREVHADVCHLPGFQSLQWLLPYHAHLPELYFLLMALLLGQPAGTLPSKIHFDLDSVWTFLFGVPASQPISKQSIKTDLCVEATVVLLAMVRAMLNQQQWQTAEEGSWMREYPVTVVQFLLFLYHHQPNFTNVVVAGDFLSALASTLFPYRNGVSADSELSSPVEEFKAFPNSEPMVLVKMMEPTEQKSTCLTTHPANKFVMDFLRILIVDSLYLPHMGKSSAAPLDLVLEASPENSTRTQRHEFQTKLLHILMDHLLAADVLLGEQAAVSAAASNYVHIAQNVFYFAGRVVDKLWQGAYSRDSKEVFDFISKLISQSKRKSSGVSLDGVYRCLNRTILHQLSRPLLTVADHASVLDTLHKLTNNRSLVFGPGNYDQEFIGSLVYCLIQLTEDPNSISEPPCLRTTTWHVDTDGSSDSDDEGTRHKKKKAQVERMNSGEGMQLLSTAAQRVWEELYVCKKPAIEEIFKVSLNSHENTAAAKISTPTLNSVRVTIQEAASRLWLTYYENERKCVYSQTERIQSQLQSKLQKVGHGVLRLATRKPKKDVPLRAVMVSMQQFQSATVQHVSIMKDLVDLQYKQYLQCTRHMERYLLEEWSSMETELMRERGLWGPPVGSELDKWLLDVTEGPHRMRKKMMRNELFYIHYPYNDPENPSRPGRQKAAISKDSKEYYQRYRSHSLIGDERRIQPLPEENESHLGQDNTPVNPSAEVFSEDKFNEAPINPPSLLPGLSKQTLEQRTANDDDDDGTDMSSASDAVTEGESQPDSRTDNQTLARLLEEGEKISHMFRCARIQGLDTCEGLLLFGKEHAYIVDGFTLLKSKEIADIDSLPADMHEPIIPRTSYHVGVEKKKCFKFCYEDVREVHKRRYLLQPSAVEVFSSDGRNLLLSFPRKVRNKVYTRFLTVATAITDSAHESLSGQRQNAKVEPGTGLISGLLGEKSVTQRWERGEISNFEYLMCLNTLAGRSYNDLMQYPVFPWIVADYDSEELDLKDPNSFRDLSKPMGTQTEKRLKQFQKRFNDWEDPQGETPPYHYGTHYSSAMIVASYLVRMEPFTQHFLRLQGGHFDLADRMFHSVKDGWLSASKHNMADVKELIPEFFYLPQFLENGNNFDLGTKQSGVSLGDIILPTWAKGDTREFIRAHREALECDYVSSHLHEWIDLIFGYKQQGPPAVEAINVFHHLFYEGNVDIYSIDDPLKKNATIGFINNFGQIPKQLFKKPHPQKKLNLRSSDHPPSVPSVNNPADKLFFHNVDNLKPTMTPIKELKGSVGHIAHNDKSVYAVEQNKVLIPSAYNKALAWGFSDMSLRITNYDSDKAMLVFENVESGEVLCAACPNTRTIITAGTSTVVNVWEFGKGRDKRLLQLRQPLFGHTEPVTCLAASSGYNIIVSGSRDRTVIVWDLSRLQFVRQLRGHAAPVAAVCINELTGDIATCAGTYLHLWSINGDEIASINTATGRNQQILCVSMSQMMEWDSRNVVMTGSSDGVVRMWSLEFVEVADERRRTTSRSESCDHTASTASTPSRSAGAARVDNNNSAVSTPVGGVNDTNQTVMSPNNNTSQQSFDDNTLEHLKEKFNTFRQRALSVEGIVNDPSTSVGNVEFYADDETLEAQTCDDLITFDEADQSCRRSTGVDSCVDALTVLGDKASSPVVTSVQPQMTNCDQSSELSSSPLTGTPTSSTIPQSPSSEFVLVTESEVKAAVKSAITPVPPPRRNRKIGLREGFRWQRQLVFRSKLTMHTAFERKDNKQPAAVTALAVSKDHKIVYVGDAKGRVFSWSVTDQPGRVVADHWVKDEGGDSCQACNVKFSFAERRHHCRNCGQLFCSRCSRFETEIRRLRILKPVRVCQPCYMSLKAQQASDAFTASGNSRAPLVT